MADISESSVEKTPAGNEPASAVASETTSAGSEAAPEAASGALAAASASGNAEVSSEPLLNSGSASAPASTSDAASSSGAAAANSEAVLDVRPGFQITKLRPDVGKFRPESGKFAASGKSAAVAASLGFACVLGLLIGSVGAWGIGQLIASPHARSTGSATASDTAALKKNIAHIEGQLASLKTSIDHANKAVISQSKSLTERYDRSARAQADLQARLTKIGETVDRLSKIGETVDRLSKVGDTADRLNKIGDTVERLEKRINTVAASEVTGSVTPQRVAAAPAPLPVPPMSEPKKPSSPPVVEGWVLRDVFRGRALVASRHGVFEAAPGLELPGLGQVESIKQQDGRWVVVTEKGLIVASSRGPRFYYR